MWKNLVPFAKTFLSSCPRRISGTFDHMASFPLEAVGQHQAARLEGPEPADHELGAADRGEQGQEVGPLGVGFEHLPLGRIGGALVGYTHGQDTSPWANAIARLQTVCICAIERLRNRAMARKTGRSMKITAIEMIPVRVPIDPARAIVGGRGAHMVSPFLLVKVHTDEGLVGLGEVSCTPVWSGEDQVTAAHLIAAYFAPLLLGRDPTEVERLTATLARAVAGNPFTKAGIEIALWDLLGKAAGLPLYRLLGGPVRDFVPTKFSVSGQEPARAAEIAAWAVGQGFRAMKVKVGLEPEGDVARVRAVREAVGPGVYLGVDANGGWAARTAIRTIRRLEEFGIAFAEQPVAPLDVAWLADVRAAVRAPIVADESVSTPQDALALARAGAADVLSVYIGKGGGLGAARKVAAVAEAAGLTCTIGSNLELGVASAAMIHLGMATSGVGAEEYPCDILSTFFYAHDLLAEPLPITAGSARPHERPGLGVELDERAVARYRVG